MVMDWLVWLLCFIASALLGFTITTIIIISWFNRRFNELEDLVDLEKEDDEDVL